MVLRGCLLALILLSVEPSLAAVKFWSLQGRVVDQQGHPVAGASVTTYWNANGVTLERLNQIEKHDKLHPYWRAEHEAEMASNEGRLEPWGLNPVQTDAKGNFSIRLHSTNDYKLMAVDKERKPRRPDHRRSTKSPRARRMPTCPADSREGPTPRSGDRPAGPFVECRGRPAGQRRPPVGSWSSQYFVFGEVAIRVLVASGRLSIRGRQL